MEKSGENRCYTCGNFKDPRGQCINPYCPVAESGGVVNGMGDGA